MNYKMYDEMMEQPDSLLEGHLQAKCLKWIVFQKLYQKQIKFI